jgi:RNA polymerase sigma-70 factor (ECF subfamily)
MHRFGGAKLREIAAELGVSVTVAHELVVTGVAHCRSRLR